MTPKISEACLHCTARMASLCGALPDADLCRLAALAAPRHYQPGETFRYEGEPSDFVFSLTDGSAMRFRLLADGRRQVLGFLFKGDFIGLVDGAASAFSVQALEPVEVCRFPRHRFRGLLTEMPSLEAALLARAEAALAHSQDHVTLLGRKTAMEKVASFLLDIAARQSALGGPASVTRLPMTRGDIADYLGLTLETVSRMISSLRRQGLVRPVDGGLELVDAAAIEDLAQAA